MDFMMDSPEIEKQYRALLSRIIRLQNGVTASSINQKNAGYHQNYGVSIVDLKRLAESVEKNHLLALKLWNKQWRETLILASMVDNPLEVTEDQMDYWVKSAPAIEIVEQIVMNLFVNTPFAFDKARVWCLGKKKITKIAGLRLLSHLAIHDSSASDEEFESFLSILPPLSKDQSLYQYMYTTLLRIGQRNQNLNDLILMLLRTISTLNSDISKLLAKELIEELTGDFVLNRFKK